MNFKQINPNAQTLGTLIDETTFLSLFSSMNNSVCQNINQTGAWENINQTGNTNYNVMTSWMNYSPSANPNYMNNPDWCAQLMNYNYPMYWNWGGSAEAIMRVLNMGINNTAQNTLNIGEPTGWFSNQNYNNLLNIAQAFTQVLKLIYNLFRNAIPYNQTLQSEWFTYAHPVVNGNNAPWILSTNYNIQASNIPQVLHEISGYLDLYINDIIKYLVTQLKFTLEGLILWQGSTNANNIQTNQGRNFQNEGYNGNTFNPVNSTFTPTAQPVPLNQQAPGANSQQVSIGNNGNGQAVYSTIKDPLNQQNQLPQGTTTFSGINNLANANVRANSTAESFIQKINNLHMDVSQLTNLGTENVNTILKPLIYKISTLFWTLGNDYYPDNSTWGFNIW